MPCDVCPGLQGMYFMQAQALWPHSAPDIAPSLYQESASDNHCLPSTFPVPCLQSRWLVEDLESKG